MPDAVPDVGRVDRRVTEIESRVRRCAGLHGMYAAAGLLVGLFLPVAQVRFNAGDTPEPYTALGLFFTLNADYEVDHPSLVVIAAAVLTITTLTAIGAFLTAAKGQDRTAATVALAASALLVPVLLAANGVIGITDVESGSQDDPLQGWTSGTWVLLIGALACCWIGAFLRDQFDR